MAEYSLCAGILLSDLFIILNELFMLSRHCQWVIIWVDHVRHPKMDVALFFRDGRKSIRRDCSFFIYSFHLHSLVLVCCDPGWQNICIVALHVMWKNLVYPSNGEKYGNVEDGKPPLHLFIRFYRKGKGRKNGHSVNLN